MESQIFNKIFLTHKDRVYNVAKSILCNATEAEDVTQDIFEKLWLSHQQSSYYENVEFYLVRSTRNLCLDKIKHRNVHLRNVEGIKRLRCSTTESNCEKKEASELIKQIITKLPRKQKMIIQLRDIDGYDFEEIQELTGIDPNAIRVNLSRARKTVKQKLIRKMNYGL